MNIKFKVDELTDELAILKLNNDYFEYPSKFLPQQVEIGDYVEFNIRHARFTSENNDEVGGFIKNPKITKYRD